MWILIGLTVLSPLLLWLVWYVSEYGVQQTWIDLISGEAWGNIHDGLLAAAFLSLCLLALIMVLLATRSLIRKLQKGR